MKDFKSKLLIFFTILFIAIIFPVSKNINANESTLINQSEIKDTISIVRTYNSFDDVKAAGEKIFYKNDVFSGYLFFQCAYRIENSNKFIVLYINDK